MALQHFYLDEQVLASQEAEAFFLRLAPDDAKHARVLRLNPGEHIAVVDAAQDYFECEILDVSGLLPQVRIAQHYEEQTQKPSVVLVQGLAKGDKMETVIRHATELGVCEFVPLVCERSIVKLDAKKAASRTQRWRAIAKSAAMQSGQRRCPVVQEPASLEGIREALGKADVVLVCWEEAPLQARIEEVLTRGLEQSGRAPEVAHVVVVVGPEGGLTSQEVETLLASNPCAAVMSLGSSILRTETAGIVAPALVLHELNRRAFQDSVSGAQGQRA